MSRIYLDSADIDEIRRFARWGVIDGVTTTIVPTPEPGTALLVAAGLVGLAMQRRR